MRGGFNEKTVSFLVGPVSSYSLHRYDSELNANSQTGLSTSVITLSSSSCSAFGHKSGSLRFDPRKPQTWKTWRDQNDALYSGG